MEKEKKAIETANIIFNDLQQEGLNESLKKELDDWIHADAGNKELYEWLQNPNNISEQLQVLSNISAEEAWKKFQANHTATNKLVSTTFWQTNAFKIAAIFLLIVGITYTSVWVYKYVTATKVTIAQKNATLENDVNPGGNNAILTLADGSSVLLEQKSNGVISVQNGTTIQKTASGKLLYKTTEKATAKIIGNNQLVTPRGGQYFITLSDGTEVWLNAASKLIFPASFEGSKERLVELWGEAYFNVMPNKAKPFKVKTQEQITTVLGTKFNVAAYADDFAQVITLEEGKVNVQKIVGEKMALNIQPGNKAIVNNTLTIKPANIEEAIAWKNGYFLFEETELATIMKQLSRWYDVDIIFTNKNTKDRFTGKIPKNLSLKNVLRILTYSEVMFKTDGKTITVL